MDIRLPAPTTFLVVCGCGCDSQVVAIDPGFFATTVSVQACENLRSQGVVSSTWRKTDAYDRVVPVAEGWQYRDGLVTLAGRLR